MVTDTQEEVRELRARVEALQAETARLSQLVERGTNEPLTREAPNSDLPDLTEHRASRRTMFKAGAAVAAAAVATPLLSKPAAAADGGNMIIGGNNASAGGHTRLNSTGAGLLSNQNVFTVTDQQSTSQYPSAIGGVAQGDRVTNGMYAYTESRTTSTTTGHALVVRAAFGSRSHIYMPSGGSTPTFDTYAHARGELRSTGGNLWFCTAGGTPGTWRKITGPSASGAVHAISPRRAYDSRFIDGPLVAPASRLVSVANGINITTGGNTGTLVPTDATAVFFNIAIVNTTGLGWLSVTPGTATSFESSTVNWFADGQIVANGTMSTIDANRQLRVFAGSGSTDFVIDITGYTL